MALPGGGPAGEPVYAGAGTGKGCGAACAAQPAAVRRGAGADDARAERGRGAWLNGRQIHVSKTASLQEALTATGFPSHKRHVSPNIHFYQELTLRSHGVRRAGSAALDLAYVACGRLDGFWEFHLNPWDTSAGYLLVEEAGGRVTRFDGSKFRLDSSEGLATNGRIAGEIEPLFGEMFAGRGLGAIPTPAEFAARRKAAAAS